MTPTTNQPPKKLSRESILSLSTELCPKCQNLLVFEGMQSTDRGDQLVYSCPDCGTSFAFVPITEFRLFEVVAQ